jgi:signal transduction histidine kinase/CheY-like chemotaxis protein
VWLSRILLVAAFALLLGAVAGVTATANSAARAEGWVSHTLEVRRQVERLKSAVIDIETGQRGYLLIGRPSYLEPYHRARDELRAIQATLRDLASDNPAQVARIDRLYGLIARRVALSEETIEMAGRGQGAAAIRRVANGDGAALMEQIRVQLGAIDADEARLFAERQERVAAERRNVVIAVVAALLIVLGLGGMVTYIVSVYVRAIEASTLSLQREVRARESADAQLRQSQKMESLGQLTGGIAHDFNNMLQIVTGSLQLLARRLGDTDAPATKYVTSALDGANRAAVLTKRLLAFSRRQPLEPRASDVNRIIANLAPMLERTLGGAVEVETVLAGGLWPTFVDPPQLESAIVNLAVNARDSMFGAGKITIETANTFLDQRYTLLHHDVTPGQYVLVAVSDTGAGMTPDIIELAFEPFFTTKDRGAGTGLGLSQVHGFIKQSGGHVKIYSELGVGTTLKLYLPRYTGAADAGAPEPSQHIDAVSVGCSVLLVEDDAEVRAFVVEALQMLGCRVVAASGGAEALRKLGEEPDVQIVLTDVVMPEMSGRMLADQVLKLRPDMKIIFMTGFTQNAIVHNGVVDPGTRLLTKPFTISQLEMAFASALASES